MTVTVDELNDSPTFSVGMNGSLKVTRRLVIAWTDAEAFILEYKPPTIDTGGTITQSPGKAYPGFNGLLRVSTIDSIVPYAGDKPAKSTGATDGVNDYELALASLSYAVPSFAQTEEEAQDEGDPVPFLKHDIKGGGMAISLPGRGLEWAVDNEPIPNKKLTETLFVGITKHNVTWPRVVNPNWTALEQQKNTCNDAAFELRGFSYPTETLMYETYSASQTVMSDGERAWNITLHFSGKITFDEETQTYVGGWNHQWRDFGIGGDYSGFYRVQRTNGAAGTKKLVPTSDFDDLFTAGA